MPESRDARFPAGRYVNGVKVMPARQLGEKREPPPDLRPRCPKCQNQLVQIHSAISSGFWRCGDFPHCHLVLSDAVVQEAIRRQKRRLKEAALSTS